MGADASKPSSSSVQEVVPRYTDIKASKRPIPKPQQEGGSRDRDEPRSSDGRKRGCNACSSGDDHQVPIIRAKQRPVHTPQEGDTECETPITPAESQASSEGVCLAYMHSECPVNRRELGRATWAFLHTMAAYYPENPTRRQQQEMTTFMEHMARVYPCGYCADRTADELVRNPIRTANQAELSEWMCEVHNEVNDRMGKPMFDCSKVAERWKWGPADGSCGRSGHGAEDKKAAAATTQ